MRTSDNSSPLDIAISHRNHKSAKKLPDNGACANICTYDQNKKTPLCLTIEKDLLHSLIKNILQHSPDADEVEDYELLHTSVKKGYYQINRGKKLQLEIIEKIVCELENQDLKDNSPSTNISNIETSSVIHKEKYSSYANL